MVSKLRASLCMKSYSEDSLTALEVKSNRTQRYLSSQWPILTFCKRTVSFGMSLFVEWEIIPNLHTTLA